MATLNAFRIVDKQQEAADQLHMMHLDPDKYRPLITNIPGFVLPNPNIPSVNFIGGQFKAYKSTLIADFMYTYALAGYSSLLAVKEENALGVAKRTLSRGTRIGPDDQKNMVSRNSMRNISMSKDDFIAVDATIAEAEGIPLYLTDDCANIKDIYDAAVKNDVKVIGIDYFTLFEITSKKARSPREMYVEMSHFMVATKQSGMTWVVAYQVSEETNRSKETRVVYDDADAAWQLSRVKDAVTDEIDPHKIMMESIAARDGAAGKWELYVDGQYNLVRGVPQAPASGGFTI